MMFNDRRRISSTPARATGVEKSDPFGTSLPGALKPRTMGQWNARAGVIAAAKSGAIKAAPKPIKKGK